MSKPKVCIGLEELEYAVKKWLKLGSNYPEDLTADQDLVLETIVALIANKANFENVAGGLVAALQAEQTNTPTEH